MVVILATVPSYGGEAVQENKEGLFLYLSFQPTCLRCYGTRVCSVFLSTHVHMYVVRGWGQVFFLGCSPPYILAQGLSELTYLAGLASQFALRLSCYCL